MAHLTLKQAKLNPEPTPASDDIENYDQTVDEAAEQAERASRKPRKAAQTRKTAAVAPESTEAPKAAQSGSQGRTAAKERTTTAPKKTEAAKAAPKRKKAEPVQVLATNAKNAERVTVYFDPSDYEFLKYEFPAGINDTVRTLVAIMRHDERLRARVERVVRTAPRGSQRGKTK